MANGTKEKLKLTSPWVTLYKEMQELFGEDPDITISFDNDIPCVKLRVQGAVKAEALMKILPESKTFGNIECKIIVIPAKEDEEDILNTYRNAFTGNPVFDSVQKIDDFAGTAYNYVIFRKGVAQFYNDNIADVDSKTSMLYQDIAKEVFEPEAGVFFCTSKYRFGSCTCKSEIGDCDLVGNLFDGD